MGDGYIMNRGNIDDPERFPPVFTYTGKCSVKDKGVANGRRRWQITFATSGTFTAGTDMKVYARPRYVYGTGSVKQILRELEAGEKVAVRSGRGERNLVFGITVGTVGRPNPYGNAFGYVDIWNV